MLIFSILLRACLVDMTGRWRPPGRRPVALGAGYLRPFDTSENAPPRKQHVVVVREDWTVLCFDSALNLEVVHTF